MLKDHAPLINVMFFPKAKNRAPFKRQSSARLGVLLRICRSLANSMQASYALTLSVINLCNEHSPLRQLLFFPKAKNRAPFKRQYFASLVVLLTVFYWATLSVFIR